MKAGKLFSSISCHPAISTQFLVSSKTTVTFFSLDPATSQLLSHNPGSVEKEFGKSCGHLTQSIYLRYIARNQDNARKLHSQEVQASVQRHHPG